MYIALIRDLKLYKLSRETSAIRSAVTINIIVINEDTVLNGSIIS